MRSGELTVVAKGPDEFPYGDLPPSWRTYLAVDGEIEEVRFFDFEVSVICWASFENKVQLVTVMAALRPEDRLYRGRQEHLARNIFWEAIRKHVEM